jgi:endoglycosylceramidase
MARLTTGLVAAVLAVVGGAGAATVAAPAAWAAAGGSPSGGPVTAPIKMTGRWLTDDQGRVVTTRGFNIMYKIAPYYPQNFVEQDARFLADSGFTNARLGLIWAGVEPRPGIYDDALIQHQADLNALLGRYGIRTLIDFHQDGPGAWPQWATFGSQTFEEQWQHFWSNDPAADGVGIQTRFIEMWQHVASVLGKSENIIGWDPINEPLPPATSGCALLEPCPAFESGQLADFYRKVIASIRSAGDQHVVFPEGTPDFGLAPSALPKFTDARTAFNAHIYCPTFAVVQVEDPANEALCRQVDESEFTAAFDDHGNALNIPTFVSELSSSDANDVNRDMVDSLEQRFATYASWAYTNSTGGGELGAQGYVIDDNQPATASNVKLAKQDAMVVPYAQALAGIPGAQKFDRATGIYTLTYTAFAVPGATLAPKAATQIFVPQLKYPHGYTVQISNGKVISGPTSPYVLVVPRWSGANVTVTITPATDSRTDTPLQVGAVPVH